MKISTIGKISTIIILVIMVLFYWLKPNELQFTVIGRVAGFSADPYTVIIEHEEIPGFMQAMTMPFQVRDSLEIQDLEQGNTIQFEYYVKLKEQRSFISSITRVPDSLFKSAGSIQTDLGIEVIESQNYVQMGELLPNYTLIDQDGVVFETHQLKGKKVLATFIYTSCPVPDYCPLMSFNFQEIYKQWIQKDSNFVMLSISFDVNRDKPEVLKEYGLRYVEQFTNWKFITGSKKEIEHITADFSVITQLDGDQIIHNLRTVLINENGVVEKIWPDNKWTSSDVLDYLFR